MNSPKDYFFIIENDLANPDSSSHRLSMYARGSGLDIVEALGRGVLRSELLAGRNLVHRRHQGRYIELAELALGGSDFCSETLDDARAQSQPLKSYSLGRANGPFDLVMEDIYQEDSHFQGYSLRRAHEERLYEQFQRGSRSLESIIQETQDLKREEILCGRALNRLFSPNGEALLNPWSRRYQTKPLKRPLDLSVVGRVKVAEEAEIKARELLFERTPRKVTGKALNVIDLRRLSYGRISNQKPLTDRGLEPRVLYGYIDAGEFVPIYDRTDEKLLV